MQLQQSSPSASVPSPQAASVNAVPCTELSAAPLAVDSMDISVNETSEGVRDLEIESEGDDNDEGKDDTEMLEDEDGDDSDSDYDFDKDLEDFDEEDDNDELDADERFHYFESLKTEIEEHTEETERDVYVRNMLAQRDRLTGEEAAWVDKFIQEQEAWKEKNNGQSVDTYGNIVKLAKFIPENLSRKRPVRGTRK